MEKSSFQPHQMVSFGPFSHVIDRAEARQYDAKD